MGGTLFRETFCSQMSLHVYFFLCVIFLALYAFIVLDVFSVPAQRATKIRKKMNRDAKES